MSTKILNRQQVRWAELLVDYDFVFKSIFEKINLADHLSRRSDYAENASEVEDDIIFSNSTFRLFITTTARR